MFSIINERLQSGSYHHPSSSHLSRTRCCPRWLTAHYTHWANFPRSVVGLKLRHNNSIVHDRPLPRGASSLRFDTGKDVGWRQGEKEKNVRLNQFGASVGVSSASRPKASWERRALRWDVKGRGGGVPLWCGSAGMPGEAERVAQADFNLIIDIDLSICISISISICCFKFVLGMIVYD